VKQPNQVPTRTRAVVFPGVKVVRMTTRQGKEKEKEKEKEEEK
jgi:hypothetical protein